MREDFAVERMVVIEPTTWPMRCLILANRSPPCFGLGEGVMQTKTEKGIPEIVVVEGVIHYFVLARSARLGAPCTVPPWDLGAHMNGSGIPPSERTDYLAELEKRGRSGDDYEIAVSAASLADDMSVRRGIVSVRRIGVGDFRAYDPSSWLMDFVRDLDGGLFL